MIKNEETVKGIVLMCFPQGEYGRRIVLLSDRYGKITVFASGAARQTSGLIGAVRPFTMGEFTLSRGRTAMNLHGVSVTESFGELPSDPGRAFTGSYILEFCDHFAKEGMTEKDSKKMLNLIYFALKALSEKDGLGPDLIRRVFELRMLVIEGIYTERPDSASELTEAMWRYVTVSPLSALYAPETWKDADTGEFKENVERLVNRVVTHRFRSSELL